MLKKLHMSLIFSNLVVSKQLSTVIVDMRNFVTKFGKILEICKKFAGNQVNEKGNVPRCGVVPPHIPNYAAMVDVNASDNCYWR